MGMTEQEKREWVIEGLEFTLVESGWDANAAYDEELMIQVVTEAIALLKAQEPIEARLHLCESCTKLYPECDATADGIEFGCGVGSDNVIGCMAYVNRWKAQEPIAPVKVNRYMETDENGNWFSPDTFDCGNCNSELHGKAYYCHVCGKAVKWG